MSIEVTAKEAKAIIRLVLVAEIESRADTEDWEMAYRLADAFGWPRPGDDIGKEAWDFYWPSSFGGPPLTSCLSSSEETGRPTVRYGCHSCLAGYDWPAEVADPEKPHECPWCGDGFGAPMPADEQPTVEARQYVQWVLERQEP